MMKKLLYAALIGTSLAAFTSCASDNEAAQDSVTNTTPAPTPTTLPMPEQSATTPAGAPAVAPQPQAAPATANAAPAPAPANGNVKLNPPHGQPGHDCAVAVGAPLNGKPSATAAPQAKPVMNVAPATTPAAPGGSGKVNPPHGQPGHDCAVAVGAPLPG